MAFALAEKVNVEHATSSPRLDAEDEEGQVQCGCAARERDRMLDSGHSGDLALERVDVRPEGRNPVRSDCVSDQLELTTRDVRR